MHKGTRQVTERWLPFRGVEWGVCLQNFRMELETLSSQLATATYDRDQFRQRAEALDVDLTALHVIRSQLDDSLKALREEHTVGLGVRGDLTKHNRELAGEIHRYVEDRRLGD